MRIDESSLAFGYTANGAGNPNWSIALGQSQPYYKINLEQNPGLDEILIGMTYCAIPVSKVTTRMGKGAPLVTGSENGTPIISAAIFSKVYVNDIKIEDSKFILLIDKDKSPSHAGRLRLRYSKHNAYNDGTTEYSNNDFYKKVQEILELAEDACWFVYDISVVNQDTLHMRAIVVNKEGPVTYADSTELHSAWRELIRVEVPEDERAKNLEGENILLYGVPGCGKSHEIKTKYCKNKAFMERVVFHPDYTYSDFIGQILPKTDGDTISYPFVAGPFTEILKKAILDENKNMYYLVIEEINRGNAPAIFGEVFQLLDRENGESEYGITNFDIAKHIYGEGNEEKEIKIPSNLTILATMNTADQNVFTLDTAFKRRWSMRSIKNDIPGCDHAGTNIEGTRITWQNFAEKINDTIIDINEGNISSEDNRLGAYFIKEDDLKDRKTFAEKVLMYLWNDAFKYDRDKIFKAEYKTLEKLLDAFCENGFAVFSPQLGFDETLDRTTNRKGQDVYLQGKNEKLVDIYKIIRDKVLEKVSNSYIYTVASEQYIVIGSDDNKKNSFADVKISKKYILFSIEKPQQQEYQSIGVEIKNDGHHNHYFEIKVTEESNIEVVVAAILDSYEQLKKEN